MRGLKYMKSKERLLVFGKPTVWFEIVERFLLENFEDVVIVKGDWGDPLPLHKKVESEEGTYYTFAMESVDYIISFCCPWILPNSILTLAEKAAINFHPAPPKYPGIGGYNYAIYNEDTEYGCTVHYMKEVVDTGDIIDVKYVPTYRNDSIQALSERTKVYMIKQFFECMNRILSSGLENYHFDEPNYIDGEEVQQEWEWEREPYTRKEFQEFCRINVGDFDEKQLELFLRATYFPNARDPPYILVKGKKWRLSPLD